MKATQVIAALRAGWWMAVVGLVVGGAVALGLTLLQPVRYASTVQFMVTVAGQNQSQQASQLAEQRAASYARLATGSDLAQRVIGAIRLDMKPTDLRQEIGAAAVPGTVLIDVTVTDSSAERAQRIAGAVGRKFTGLVAEVESQGNRAPAFGVVVSDRPDVPGSPVSRAPVRNIALGLLAGLFVGIAGTVARHLLVLSGKDERRAAVLAGAAVVGRVPKDDALTHRRVIEPDASPATAESFRRLRDNLQWLDVDEPPKTVMITGGVRGQGATTVVVNLAMTLANTGRRVVVVEGDLLRPGLADDLGFSSSAGLTNVLAGSAQLGDVVQRYGRRNVWVIPAGPTPPDPGRVLASGQMQALIDKLRGDFDHVLVDGPPVLERADAAALAGHTDGVLLAARPGSLRPDQLRRAATVLADAGVRMLGVIVTLVPSRPGRAQDRRQGDQQESS